MPEGIEAINIGIEADAFDDNAHTAPVVAHGLSSLYNSNGALLGLPFAAVFNSAASSGEIETA
jgi:hypothetical protein